MSDPLLTKTTVAEATEEATDTLVEAFRPPPNTLFLHAKQMEVYKHPARFQGCRCGPQVGKMPSFWNNDRNGRWFAPPH